MQINTFDIVLGAGLVTSIVLIVYIFKTNRDLAKTVIEEKITILKYTIPIIESITPSLPPDKQAQARECVEALKMMQAINEALLQTSVTSLRKTWKAYSLKLAHTR